MSLRSDLELGILLTTGTRTEVAENLELTGQQRQRVDRNLIGGRDFLKNTMLIESHSQSGATIVGHDRCTRDNFIRSSRDF